MTNATTEEFIRQSILNILENAPDDGLGTTDIFKKIYPNKNRYTYESVRVAATIHQFKKLGVILTNGTRGKYKYLLNKDYTHMPKKQTKITEHIKVEAILSFLAKHGPATLRQINNALIKECRREVESCDTANSDSKCIKNKTLDKNLTSERLLRLTRKGILVREGGKMRYTYQLPAPSPAASTVKTKSKSIK